MSYTLGRKLYNEFFHVLNKDGTAINIDECVYCLNAKDNKIAVLRKKYNVDW